MAAAGASPVPVAVAPTRPTGKLSIVTTNLTGGAIASPLNGDNAVTSPRTPRRESAKPGLAPRQKPPLQASAKVATPATVANTTATTPNQHPPGADAVAVEPPSPAAAAGAIDGATSSAKTAAKPATAGTRRWGLIRKGIVPNPAIMKVNEKVVQIIQTLRKAPEDRSETDIKLLYTWLMNQEKLSSLFTTMSEISAKKLCKEMEFLHLDSGDVVVNQGEKGNTCFILVSGMVSVYVRSSEEQKKYHRVTRAAVDGSNARALMEQGLITFGAKVATLTPGATFGELCLIEPDSKRSATVIVDPAAQVANFIVLTAASYLRMTRSQTIEGTITDHIAFLQHTLLFRKWTKMQLMHLVNSMKLLSVPAGQHIAHKGADADSFFMILRGEVQECVRIMLNEHSEMSVDENRGVQHCVTVQLTFLGKFDVAGEYLAAEKKVVTCPVDIRAVTDVDCLVLSRKLFNMHFGGKDIKKHAAKALKKLRVIAQQRETWRETRIDQALQYPNLRVPITRKLMRLSGNCCVICGRDTHVAGDELCMELAVYRMDDEKMKKRSQAKETRAVSKHRISIVVPPQTQGHVQTAVARAAQAQAKASKRLPALNEDAEEEDEDEDDQDSSGSSDGEDPGRPQHGGRHHRLGHRLLRRQWKAAERAGLTRPPQRPSTTPLSTMMTTPARKTPRDARITSITREQHVSKRTLLLQQQQLEQLRGLGSSSQLDEEVRRIRSSWPYGWRDLEPVDGDPDALPHFERLYRNKPRPKSPSSNPRAAPPSRPPHTAR